jgi:hypothetical protein
MQFSSSVALQPTDFLHSCSTPCCNIFTFVFTHLSDDTTKVPDTDDLMLVSVLSGSYLYMSTAIMNR